MLLAACVLPADAPAALDWFVIPFPIHTPETDWALTLSAVGSGRLGDDLPASSLVATSAWSENDQKRIAANASLYLANGWWFNAGVAAEDWPTQFYGLGNDTDVDDEEFYDSRNYKLDVALKRRVGESLWFGPRLLVQDYRLDAIDPDGLLAAQAPPGIAGGRVTGVGLVATRDTRDDVLAPDRGSYIGLEWTVHGDGVGSDYSFREMIIDARQFRSVRPGWVLATTQYLGMTRGEVPFQHLSAIGKFASPSLLRGHISNRFLDRDVAAAQAELRLPLRGRLGAVVFAGVGDVARRLGDLRFGDLKTTGGAGLRFRVGRGERVNLRLDVGIAGDETGVYFNILEAF